MNIVGIIQARMGSSRLPGKILMELCGKPVLYHIVQRINKSKYINTIAVATSNDPLDNAVENFAKTYNINLYRGSLNDVLDRFYMCAKKHKADIIIRFTGDNALIDSQLIDEGIELFLSNNLDYLRYRDGLPIGMAVEIFTYKALERAHQEAVNDECREHVTPYMYKNNNIFKSHIFQVDGKDYSNLRWTLDTQEDMILIKNIYESIYPRKNDFNFNDILNSYKSHPEWININDMIIQKKVKYEGKDI